MRTNNIGISISKDEIKALPLTSFPGEIIVVDHPGSVTEAVKLLKGNNVLGFDTETKPAFKKGVVNGVAIMQLATRDRVFIFRLNKTGLTPPLAALLSDARILKVGAAIRDDLRSLRKLNGFCPAGFIELQDLVKEYNIVDCGLRKLAGIILGIQISKAQQVSNWEKEILTNAQLNYAATDAWVCHEIYLKLAGVK